MQQKLVRNAGWIVLGRALQMLLSFAVATVMARRIGPEGYGMLSYVESFLAFFAPLSALGLENILVKELVQRERRQGAALGTAMAMQAVSGLFCAAALTAVVALLNRGNRAYALAAALFGAGLLFKGMTALQCWYQAKLMAKVSAAAGVLACAVMSAYRVHLLMRGSRAEWFALSAAVEALSLGAVLLLHYRRSGGPKLSFSAKLSAELLGRSRHFILSGLMISVYWQLDKIMLRHLAGEAQLGYYSVASRICSLWTFMLTAAIDTARPMLFELLGRQGQEAFAQKLKMLYSLIIYASAAVSLVLTAFAPSIIRLLYGKAYLPGVPILCILTWGTAFSYLGAARNIWALSFGGERYEKHMALMGAACNAVLNWLLIPALGATGAALATLATQILVNYPVLFLFRPLRPNGMLITQALDPRTFKGLRR